MTKRKDIYNLGSMTWMFILLIVFPSMKVLSVNPSDILPEGKNLVSFRNGDLLFDTTGKVINAHGGGILKKGDVYYWIGENRRNRVLISCYKSTNLRDWTFVSDLLTRESDPELIKANLERPKVVYNPLTRKYVMWMHYENYNDYSLARAAIAVSDDIEKPFTYLRSFRPLGHMSRDCTLYKDEDGKAYFISAARENYDLHMYQLNADFTDIDHLVNILWPGGHREAPAIFKNKGVYFLMTSGCTGWDPNQGKYAWSSKISGPWSELKEIGNSTTYNTQSTYILPYLTQKGEERILYIGDRWNGQKYFDSRYVFLPMQVKNDSTLELKWEENFDSGL